MTSHRFDDGDGHGGVTACPRNAATLASSGDGLLVLHPSRAASWRGVRTVRPADDLAEAAAGWPCIIGTAHPGHKPDAV